MSFPVSLWYYNGLGSLSIEDGADLNNTDVDPVSLHSCIQGSGEWNSPWNIRMILMEEQVGPVSNTEPAQ